MLGVYYFVITKVSLAFCAAGVYCGPPQSDQVAMIMGHSFYFGDRVSYMCRPGLVPATMPLLTCQHDGTWDKLPKCLGQCPPRHRQVVQMIGPITKG